MMTAQSKQEENLNNQSIEKDLLVNSVRILSDITRKDIEKSFNSPDVQNTRNYFSNRYGETLKRTVD